MKTRSFSLSDNVLCLVFYIKAISQNQYLTINVNNNRSKMFSVFRRRTASGSRSDQNVKENSPVKAKPTNDNTGFTTPTLTASATGNKPRTFSGASRTSSTTSLVTSPLLNITRQQEKHELQTLNDRLAVIIDTVRRLEQDNEKLRVNLI